MKDIIINKKSIPQQLSLRYTYMEHRGQTIFNTGVARGYIKLISPVLQKASRTLDAEGLQPIPLSVKRIWVHL